MDLRDYLRVLRKSWALILAFVVAGIAAGVGLAAATTKVYQADTQLFVATSGAQDQSELAQGNTYVQALVQSLTNFVTSPSVVEPVIKKLGLSSTPTAFAAKLGADAPLNKVLINVHASDHDPVVAAQIANAVAEQYITVVQDTVQTDSSGKPAVRLSVIHPAVVPSEPISPNTVLDVGLGLVIGLLVGVGVAVLREVLDNTVKGPGDFEASGLAVLGLVPFDKRAQQSPVSFRSDPHSARSEAYRQLRTNLQFVDVDDPPRIIAVTSAVPGEGKTTTAINLAAALAETGARVCLIEADLRRPSVARTLGLIGDVGFTTAVIGRAPVESVLQNAGRNLAVLTSGPIPPNPSELLMSAHAKQVITDLARNVDFTIIDTPPLLPVTDGAELATMADATVLVHRAAKTTRDQAARSLLALEQVGRRPVGVILNMVNRSGSRFDYEYTYYYTPRRDDATTTGPEHSGHVVDAPHSAGPLDADDSADSADLVAELLDGAPSRGRATSRRG